MQPITIYRNGQQVLKLASLALVLALVMGLLLPAATLAQTTTVSIKAYKFNDLNGNGVQDTGEGPLAGWVFTLFLPDGSTRQATSGADGHAVFSNVDGLFGDYQVTETAQPDWINTTPLTQSRQRSASSAWNSWLVAFGNRLLPKDYGDLPAEYGITTLAENGARHLPGELWLGPLVDDEMDGQPSPDARQDDTDNEGDEDGVQAMFTAPEYWNNGQGTIQVMVSGATGCFNAWFDVWNSAANGVGVDYDFADSGAGWSEHAIVNLMLAPGTHALNFPLPVRQTSPDIFARYRLSPLVNGSCAAYDGMDLLRGIQTGGEVEDVLYRFSPTAVVLSGFSAETAQRSPLLVLGILWLVGLGMLTLALDMKMRQR